MMHTFPSIIDVFMAGINLEIVSKKWSNLGLYLYPWYIIVTQQTPTHLPLPCKKGLPWDLLQTEFDAKIYSMNSMNST